MNNMTTTVSPIILAAADVAHLSGRIDAIEIMREAFRSLAGGTAVQPPQTLTLFPQDAGDFITYLGVLAEAKVFGAKLSPYLSRPDGGFVTAWTVLMSMQTGQPILLCDSKQLTVERTAATTALAVDLLAPQSAARLSVVGAGPVAQAHVRHIRHLRPWRDIRIHSRTNARSPQSGALMASIDERIQIETNLDRAIDDADVILLCTSSGAAVIDPASLRKPALITSISTNVPKAHEVPPGALGNMDVYCDYRATTPSSAGEMQLAAAEHGWSVGSVVGDLPELTIGSAALPSYARHAFFRSIGLGLEDVAMAHALLRLVQNDNGSRENSP
jgi:L-arginine dehydrogenase